MYGKSLRGGLLLYGPPGCGKTFTLMKVVDAVVKGQLGDVALMAYNKKIADELKVKLEGDGMWINGARYARPAKGSEVDLRTAGKVTVDGKAVTAN